jgi:hypothetical protein
MCVPRDLTAAGALDALSPLVAITDLNTLNVRASIVYLPAIPMGLSNAYAAVISSPSPSILAEVSCAFRAACQPSGTFSCSVNNALELHQTYLRPEL